MWRDGREEVYPLDSTVILVSPLTSSTSCSERKERERENIKITVDLYIYNVHNTYLDIGATMEICYLAADYFLKEKLSGVYGC